MPTICWLSTPIYDAQDYARVCKKSSTFSIRESSEELEMVHLVSLSRNNAQIENIRKIGCVDQSKLGLEDEPKGTKMQKTVVESIPKYCSKKI